MSLGVQAVRDRRSIDADVTHLDQVLSQVHTQWVYETNIADWNRQLVALAHKISAANCIDERQVGIIRALMGKVALVDQQVEARFWNQAGIESVVLAPLRGMNLYRAATKIDAAVLEQVLPVQEKRLAQEKRIALHSDHSVFVRESVEKMRKKLLDTAGCSKTLCTAVPGGDAGRYVVLLLSPREVKVHQLTLRVEEQFVQLIASGRRKETFLECLKIVLPGAEFTSLKQAKIAEMQQHYYAGLTPRDEEEARDWLLLVDQEQPRPCLFIYNPKKLAFPEGTFTLVIKDGGVKQFTVQDNGFLEGCDESFSTLQEFENKYPVSYVYKMAFAMIEKLKPRVEVDLLRFLTVVRNASYTAGITESAKAEAALLKAGQHDAFVIWKELRYGMLPEQYLEREEFRDAPQRVPVGRDAHELIPKSVPPYITVLSVRRSKTGQVEHYDLGVKEGTILLGNGAEACSFTTQGLSRDRLYRRFEEAGFGMSLHHANVLREKRVVFESLRGGMYQSIEALKQAEARLYAQNESTLQYAVTFHPAAATDETWETLTIKKFIPRRSFIALLRSRQIQETKITVNAQGQCVFQDGKPCDPVEFIRGCTPLA